MTITKAITIFMTTLKFEHLSPHTLKAYEQDLYQFKDFMKEQELENLDFETFQEYLTHIQELSLKTSSIKRKRVVLHRFLKFCHSKGLSQKELHQYIDPIKTRKDSKPKEVLNPEDLTKIFNYVEDEQNLCFLSKDKSAHYQYLYYCTFRNKLLLSILLYTGCRAQEVVSLKKSDINLEQNTITLLTKGNKYNTIPIHDMLLDILKQYDEHLQQLEGSDLYIRLKASQYLFPSKVEATTHLSTRTLHDLMKKLEKVIDRPLHAHIFRHTFASYCIAANMDISTISSLISHSNPSITLSIYTHEIDALQKQRELAKLKFNID